MFPLVAPSAGVMLCACPVPAPSAPADELAAVGPHTAPLPVSPSQPSSLSTCVFVCWGSIICITWQQNQSYDVDFSGVCVCVCVCMCVCVCVMCMCDILCV